MNKLTKWLQAHRQRAKERRQPNYEQFISITIMEKETIKGYKGFDKDLKCRGYQYEVGKDYEHNGNVKCCENGFHFCEHPLDVFNYYPPSESRFCEVVGSGDCDKGSNDSKVATSKLHIKAEIGLKGIVEAAVRFVFDRVNWKNVENLATGNQGAASATGYRGAASATGNQGAASATGDRGAASATGYQGAASATGYQGAASATGYQGAASATGDRGAASSTGYRGAASATGYQGAASATGYRGAASATGNQGAASATGYRGAASATGNQGAASATGDQGAASATGDQGAASVGGKESVAIVTGKYGKAKGALGCWIVLTERGEWNGETFPIKEVKAFKVDGDKIKANTYYKLINGEAVEVK